MRKPSDLARSGLTRIDTDAFMRAAAICSIVWNHANPSALGAFGGGMTFLMMLSGFNFARFSLQGGTPESVRAALVRLGLRIGVPSFLLVLFFFAALHRFDARELLFVSNWWTRDRISLFPLWYPEVMLQMFVLLYLLFLTPLGRVALSHMLAFSLAIFLVGAGLRYALPFVWNTEYLNHDLPHLYLWNFTLGWVIFFLVVARPPTALTVLLAIGCVALGSAVGWGVHRLDFWWLIVSGAIFVLFRTLLLPRIVAQVAGISGGHHQPGGLHRLPAAPLLLRADRAFRARMEGARADPAFPVRLVRERRRVAAARLDASGLSRARRGGLAVAAARRVAALAGRAGDRSRAGHGLQPGRPAVTGMPQGVVAA
ncbi:hypothetical protein [Sphingomonas nostoxanthinifaciens]|uniref:hypothetical protein n=1 Tax=Sphingomonas nostoxanthinifaciens TaxID=2872652 RepID=UPI001CC20A0E|nr:hypothetical protein [Sphingomonas nostoxanthinifaciens]UAK25061.1 hypothetical protein K8P63_02280 [Sphingomonas nostoxanthinifaciens]